MGTPALPSQFHRHKQERGAQPQHRPAARSSSTLHSGRDAHGNGSLSQPSTTRERRQTRHPFHRDGKAYWGGIHRELGLLIYDRHAQQRLAADKGRLYVVADRRLATFVKDRVRARLLPSCLETWWCPQHEVVMRPWPQAQGTR
jgi:hypothetical protein